MVKDDQNGQEYLYTYSCHEDELSLCHLEMRSLFGIESQTGMLKSTLRIDPSRSPFIKERLDIIFKGCNLEEIIEQVATLKIVGQTFKNIFLERGDMVKSEKVRFEQRRIIERTIGLQMDGKVDLNNPELLFGIMKGDEGWIFGKYHKSESIWLRHQKKPQNYSTALSTRVARAVVNIAIPKTDGMKVIDPCCGIGTVLIEALSMGIDIVGSDINPLAAIGARENLAYFNLTGEVTLRDIEKVKGMYDVAIIDMPYNLCSIQAPKEQLVMLQSARNFAKKSSLLQLKQ